MPAITSVRMVVDTTGIVLGTVFQEQALEQRDPVAEDHTFLDDRTVSELDVPGIRLLDAYPRL